MKTNPRSVLNTARKTLYSLPETPLGWKLKKQLFTQETVKELEQIIHSQSIPDSTYFPSEGTQEYIDDKEKVQTLLDKKIKPALFDLLQTESQRPDPLILIKDGTPILDQLKDIAPAQYGFIAAQAVYLGLLRKVPLLGVLKTSARLLGLSVALNQVLQKGGYYDPLTNTMLITAGPEASVVKTITHEYTHFLQFQQHHSISKVSKFILEGHAEATALEVVIEQGHSNKKKSWISEALQVRHYHLLQSYATLCEKLQLTPFPEFQQRALAYAEGTFTQGANVYDLGVLLFTLAKRKQGKEVYGQVLRGEYGCFGIK